MLHIENTPSPGLLSAMRSRLARLLASAAPRLSAVALLLPASIAWTSVSAEASPLSGPRVSAVAVSAASSAPAAASAARKKKSSKSKSGKTSKKSSSRKGTAKSSSKKRSGASSRKKGVSKRWTEAKPVEAEKPSTDSLTLAVNSRLLEIIPKEMNPGGLRVNKVQPDARSKRARISLNDNFTYLPVTPELISELQREVSRALPDSLGGFAVDLNVGNHPLSYYITKVQPLPEKHRANVPFVTYRDPWIHPRKGMEGDILAVWHSHGRYYKPGNGAWLWQRPFLFQSVEDTYTMSYVLPFLVPMLENAGAYVMLPRERDTNPNEVIVDNDTNPDGQLFSQSTYRESNASANWETGDGEGFIYDLPDFRDTENPFENGTYRQARTVKGGRPSVAAWYADIPEDGEYAVYVSYKSLPNSTTDARYTVNYSGGSREFLVNQTMGGGTWIYLGTFPLEAGYSDSEPVVTLSNLSSKWEGRMVTADAVKIGGGMGNIARSPKRSDVLWDPSAPLEADVASAGDGEDSVEAPEGETLPDEGGEANLEASGEASGEASKETSRETAKESSKETSREPAKESSKETSREPAKESSKADSGASAPKSGREPVFKTSGLPRYLEGARYWLHWAGFPESVYSPYHGADDYKDDYTSRGLWVNYLAGGSRVLPDDEGLGIPVDLAFALHSDAGKRADDSFVGTLGIHYTAGGADYADHTPRINSRMMTDMIMRQIHSDIRAEWEPDWTRRSMWDKSYVEARIPEVPTTLIELLSHQNFADMQYGLDPMFRFTVSRAIYKALGRFMAERKGREFVVQPLPVCDFAIQRTKEAHYRLSWRPTDDKLEPSAKPTKYIVLERSGDELGFHKIGETHSTHFDVKTSDREVHSFRIVAANEGGISFPSETLAFRDAGNGRKPVLVVNGFTRVSGPESFADGDRAGFRADADFGVPYISDLSFTGRQTEFRRSAGEAFGRSSSEDVAKVVAGNTFDFAALHGRAIAESGRGFVSCSLGAVESGAARLGDYAAVDLVLGRQRAVVTGRGKEGARFAAFPEKLRECLTAYLHKGGRLIVSGEKVASDPAGPLSDARAALWAEDVLGVRADSVGAPDGSRLLFTPEGRKAGFSLEGLGFSNTLNPDIYIVQHPDVLAPSGEFKALPFLTFSGTDLPAGLLLEKGRSRQAVMSIPFESLTDEKERNRLMDDLLDWLEK